MASTQQSAAGALASITDALQRRAGDEAVRFWWRDDDAEVSSPALDRLLDLSARAGVPVGLAVIPGHLDSSLAVRINATSGIDVLVHGWIHRNHAGEGEPATEYPRSRRVAEVRDELARGLAVLRQAFPQRTLPVFVPPWNRFPPELEDVLVECGYAGLSSASANRAPHAGSASLRCAHGDLNIVAAPATACGAQIKGAALVAKNIRAGERGPFGVVTHHRLFDDDAWKLCELFWKSITSSKSVQTVPARGVFFAG